MCERERGRERESTLWNAHVWEVKYRKYFIILDDVCSHAEETVCTVRREHSFEILQKNTLIDMGDHWVFHVNK